MHSMDGPIVTTATIAAKDCLNGQLKPRNSTASPILK